MPRRKIVGVVDDESRVIVVRAWRDSGRLIVRVLAGTGRVGSSRQWVFADIDEACEHIAKVLWELRDVPVDSGRSGGRTRGRPTIRTVDAGKDHRPDD
jgi:hypothetical protein